MPHSSKALIVLAVIVGVFGAWLLRPWQSVSVESDGLRFTLENHGRRVTVTPISTDRSDEPIGFPCNGSFVGERDYRGTDLEDQDLRMEDKRFVHWNVGNVVFLVPGMTLSIDLPGKPVGDYLTSPAGVFDEAFVKQAQRKGCRLWKGELRLPL
jgi:hypothetical protein